jgi:molybdopterin synthase catalytic subunit
MITAYAAENVPDPPELYRTFLEREDDRSGTVLLHHGRVKRPGKQVPDFGWLELKARTSEVDAHFVTLGETAKHEFRLRQVLLVHRLGRVEAGDTVLVALVSGETRDRCFDACRFLVDEVKREEIVELIEHPSG